MVRDHVSGRASSPPRGGSQPRTEPLRRRKSKPAREYDGLPLGTPAPCGHATAPLTKRNLPRR
jgi:hypothetical protein